MPQQAVWRGLLEGFSQLLSFFIEVSQNFILLFLHNKAAKNLKTISAYAVRTDLNFKTFKKIIHLVTQSLQIYVRKPSVERVGWGRSNTSHSSPSYFPADISGYFSKDDVTVILHLAFFPPGLWDNQAREDAARWRLLIFLFVFPPSGLQAILKLEWCFPEK